MSFETACREFDRRFHAAVNSHMVADVPVGAFLSGGVDSSSIVRRRTRHAPPIETFSITFRGLDEFDESPFAAKVAAHCGAHHHEFNLTPDVIDTLPEMAWHADEPFAISSGFALYHLSQPGAEARQGACSAATAATSFSAATSGGTRIFPRFIWRGREALRPPARRDRESSRSSALLAGLHTTGAAQVERTSAISSRSRLPRRRAQANCSSLPLCEAEVQVGLAGQRRAALSRYGQPGGNNWPPSCTPISRLRWSARC